MPNYKFFLIGIVVLFFFGCGRKTQEAKPALLSKADIQHIKLQDIPMPVGFVPSTHQTPTQQHQTSLSYKGNLPVAQSVMFCKKSMELNGWDIQDFSVDQEGLLFCNKSKKKCAISIRKNTGKHTHHKTNILVTINKIKPNHHKNIESINKKIVS